MLGALLSACAALLHVGCIVFGARWYRFFGAGEKMARMAQAGNPRAALITSGIVILLSVWAWYALSGAGLVGPMPLLRTGLTVIASVYVLRGLVLIPILIFARPLATPFWWWSSAICLAFGLIHIQGLRSLWHALPG
ncbi:MAG: hypothetical protein V4723_17555 [Pseudomonadota bacterium]